MSADEHEHGRLRSLALRGVSWKLASQGTGLLVNLATTLVLARLLVPRDFGLAAMALVFGSLGYLVSNVGLGDALVQRETLTEEDKSTAFWTSLALGTFLTVLGVVLAGSVASLYREPAVRQYLMVFSLGFFVTAVGLTQGSLLIREFRFRSLEVRTILSSLAGAITAIVLAALGYGPWAIIFQGLVNATLSTILLWRASPWRPRLMFSRASLRKLAGFSGLVFGTNSLFYLERNADNLLVGRFIGAHGLGAYTVAYNAMLVPLVRLASPIQQVFFPTLSRVREPARVGELWVRATRVVSAITIPAFVGLAVVAPDFVHIVLGEKWAAAAPILRILAWVGILQAVAWQTMSVLLALDRASTMFAYSVVSSIAAVAAFATGLHWGILGVATAYAIVSTVLAPGYIRLGCKAVGIGLGTFLRALVGVAAAAAGMGLLLLGLSAAVHDHLAVAPRLALFICAGAASYAALASWLVPELREELRGLRGRPSSPPKE